MAAAGQVDQVVVAEVRHHLAQARVGAEEVVADVRAVLDAVALELAVDGGVQLVEQHAVLVLGQQLVPLRPEDDLDDVPAGAAEHGLELLDDLAVAAHRAVEALQVAVDDEDEVVELLAAGQRERAERLGLVALAVAEERPHAALAGVVELRGSAGSG